MFCFTRTKGDQIAKVCSHVLQLESTDFGGNNHLIFFEFTTAMFLIFWNVFSV